MKRQADRTKFRKAVKIRLIELDMTQAELAELLGIRKQYLSRILSGERSGKKYLADIVKILKIDYAA